MKSCILIFLFFLSTILYAETETTPIQIAIYEPYQLADSRKTVVGFRFNLFYGVNENVYGLDTGLINTVKNNSAGISLGLVNFTRKHSGAQLGIFNFSERVYGFQIGVVNASQNPHNIQIGVINIGFKDHVYMPMLGVLVNWADGALLGQYSIGFNQSRSAPLQVSGILNNTNDGNLQFSGGFNYSNKGGLQIAGLSNLSKNTFIQISTGVNISNYSYFQIAGLLNTSEKSIIQTAIIANSVDEGIIQLAIIGNTADKVNFQIAGLGNFSNSNSWQISSLFNENSCTKECPSSKQISLFYNSAKYSQTQVSLINQSNFSVFQFGGINLTGSTNYSQVGIINRALKTNGSMIGLINESHDLYGFQLGFINIAKNARFPFTLFYNSNYEERSIRNNTGFVSREWSPIQISFYAPVQIYTNDTEIDGLRLGLLYSKNDSVKGLDLGLFNRSIELKGLEIGGINQIEGKYAGFQLGIINLIEDNFYGVQIGIAQFNQKSLYGFGFAPIAITKQDVNGMQVGILANYGKKVLFPQLSLGVNMAESTSVQISGIGNYSESHLTFPQITGGFNYTNGNVNGQVGGLFNVASGIVIPGQISLIFNRAKFTPFQLAGIGNHAETEAYIQLAGIFNMVSREMRSAPFSQGDDPYVQVALFFNLSRKTYFQASAFNIDSGQNFAQIGAINFASQGHLQVGGINIDMRMEGMQVGLINGSSGYGMQVGGVNLNDKFQGVSVGAWNMTESYNGVQVGLFNLTKKLKGIQFGLINIHLTGNIPIMIGVNAGNNEL